MSRTYLRHLRDTGLILVFLTTASAATADDIQVRGTVMGEALVNTDLGATVGDARLDFEVDVGPLTFGGAYRAYDFGDREYNPAGIQPQHELKHRYIEVERNGLLVRAGHYFSTFGRGLTLRSFEDIDLEHDTALDGFMAEYGVGMLVITALAGELEEGISDVQHREHRLRGGRIQADLCDMVTVAASGLDRNSKRYDQQVPLPEEISEFNDAVFGGELEIWVGPVGFAGEHAWRRGGYYPLLRQGEVEGRATYLSANATAGPITLLGEYKDYERFDNEMASPPVCVKEHVWTLMNRVTHQVDFGNERGFLVEGMLDVPGDLHITGSASEARTQQADLMHWEIFTQIDQVEPLLGIRSLAGSWSREYAGGFFTEYLSGAADLEFDIGSDRIIEVAIEAQMTEDALGDNHEDALASVSLYPGPGVTVSILGEATNSDDEERDAWAFGEIRAEIAQDLEVSLGGGTERGGKKCSGGICYTAPEFAGVRIQLSTFF